MGTGMDGGNRDPESKNKKEDSRGMVFFVCLIVLIILHQRHHENDEHRREIPVVPQHGNIGCPKQNGDELNGNDFGDVHGTRRWQHQEIKYPCGCVKRRWCDKTRRLGRPPNK
jgi:hypothetical protein